MVSMDRLTKGFLALSLLLVATAARAEVPPQIHYQGVLVDAAGNPATGDWTVTFGLFENEEGGDPLFQETRTITLEKGVLSVLLGAQQGNALAPDLLAAGSLWLEIGFDGDEGPVVLTPRQKVVSHPYALHAGHAEVSEQAANAAQLGGKEPDAFVELASLGQLCIAPDDLADLLADLGFVAGAHYSDADVAAYLADNGFTPGGTSYTDEDVAAYLDGAGYVAGPHYTDGDVQAWLDDSGYVAGPHYTDGDAQAWLDAQGFVPGDHYTDGDVQTYLDAAGYVTGPHYSDANVQTYLSENGFASGPHYTDGDVQAWLDAQGYVPGDHYTDGQVQVYLDAAGYIVGPHYSDADVQSYLSDNGYASGPHYTDGDVQVWLDAQGYVTGPHLELVDVLDAVAAEGYLKPGEPIPPEMLPPDGLDEVSNGLLTTTFDATFSSTETPKTVPDAYLGGITDVITVPDVGKIQDVTVSLNVQHPSASDLKVVLTAPGGQTFLLHDHGEPLGGGIVTSFDEETQPLEGDLSVLDGTYATGDWTLKLVDDQLENEGTLLLWSVNVEALSEQSVKVNGDLAVAGNFALDDSQVNRSSLETLTAGADSPAVGLHTHTDLAVYFVENGGVWSGGGATVPQGGNYQNIYSGAVNPSDPSTAGLSLEQVAVSCNHAPGWAGYVCCCAKGTVSGDNGSFTLEEKCGGATNQTVKLSWSVSPAIKAASGGSLSMQGKSCGGGINFSAASITGDKFLPVKRLQQ